MVGPDPTISLAHVRCGFARDFRRLCGGRCSVKPEHEGELATTRQNENCCASSSSSHFGRRTRESSWSGLTRPSLAREFRRLCGGRCSVKPEHEGELATPCHNENCCKGILPLAILCASVAAVGTGDRRASDAVAPALASGGSNGSN